MLLPVGASKSGDWCLLPVGAGKSGVGTPSIWCFIMARFGLDSKKSYLGM